MVRFQVGQQAGAASGDSGLRAFALEVDGVDLLLGAGEEPPARVLPELLLALGPLHKGRSRCGQLSLPDSHLELCLFRLDDAQVELSVVRFARPIQLLVRPLVVELSVLTQAARECALTWKAAALLAAQGGPLPGRAALAQGLKGLEGRQAPLRLPERSPFSFHSELPGPPALSVRVEDLQGRRYAYDRRSKAHLPPLLFPGEVKLGGTTLERQPPLLTLLDLTREALAEEPGARLPEGVEVRKALFQVSLDLVARLIDTHPGLSRNPYLEVLTERCQLGLAALSPSPAPRAGRRAGARPKKARPAADLAPGRALRRLRFQPVWERPAEWGDGAARLLLSGQGVTVAGTHVALGYGPNGEVRFRRMGTHGVATSADGTVLSATAGRLLCFSEGRPSAQWLRDHDGTPIGPELFRAGAQLVVRWGPRGVAGVSAVTGRELWRVDPPRARVTAFSVEHDRALLPTDAGLVVAVHLADGVPGFRMRATYPVPHRLVRMKTRYLGVLAQGTTTAVFSVDLDAAAIAWTRELPLANPSEPLVHRSRIYLAGEADGRGALALLDQRGMVLWERALPLARGPYQVVPAGMGVLVQDAQGSAALVVGDGEVDWRVGGSSAPLSAPVAPHVARGIAVLPGELTRVVELRSGRQLAELPMRNLMDLKVDRKLRIFTLEDHGTLRALALTAQLAVV